MDGEVMMKLNEEFQNQMAIAMISVDDELEARSNLEISIILLDIIVKSNNNNRRIDTTVFINETCSDHLNMNLVAKEYYSKKKSKKGEPEKFIFLDYPWLFSTASKVDAIQIESKYRMDGELMNLLNPDENGDFNFSFLNESPVLNIQVRRANILDDSLRALSTQSKNFKKQMKVKFVGEEGVDQGGVKKEFFHLLMKELFNPNYAMFEQKLDGRYLWFNKLSLETRVNFELIGSLLALAIYNSVLLPAPFPKAVYKKLLNEHVTLEVELYNRLGLERIRSRSIYYSQKHNDFERRRKHGTNFYH